MSQTVRKAGREGPKNRSHPLAKMQARIDALEAELAAARERETATADVLRVINSSLGDLAPVFDRMLEKATQLCEARFGILWTHDGERFHPAAVHGLPAAFAEFLSRPIDLTDSAALGDIARARRYVHVADLAGVGTHSGSPLRRATVDLGKARTGLGVPLLKDDAVLGIFVIYRQEVWPFSDKQIALLENFAAQAVIAMENARLLTETREALEQQTATAEVLQAINSSPGDLTPVFDAMLNRAIRLCDASHGHFRTYDGERFNLAAVQGEPGLVELHRQLHSWLPGLNNPMRRILEGERLIHIADTVDSDGYRSDPGFRELVDTGAILALLAVAMYKDEKLLGYMSVYRHEVRPFSGQQIALLQSFAEQAVIAMENARLLTETREALEQQTATSEVLRVISSSPTDVQPTFDAIAESAIRICGAASGGVFRFDGSQIDVGTFFAPTHAEREAVRDVFPIPPSRGSTTARAILTREAVLILDPSADPDFAHASLHQFGTTLSIPMLKDGNPLGAITVARNKVEAFSDKQIELLKTFADQAVIAIENVRLFNELNERTRDLQESLEYQTATSDVLQVISQSTFDLEAVLEAVVAAAIRLCRAEFAAIYRNEDGEYRWAVGGGNREEPAYSIDYERIERSIKIRPGTGTLVGRTALEGRPVQIPDVLNDPLYEAKDDARIGNARTMLGVPLLREGAPIGVIGLVRNRVEPFSEREIQLVTTFADQAAIAIENVRLITETREALEQQTATAEVLGVINSSPGDLTPVFDAMLDKAMGLCDAAFGMLQRYDGERFEATVVRGLPPAYAEFLRNDPPRSGPGTAPARILAGEQIVHIHDLKDEQAYRNGDPRRCAMVDLGGARTSMAVALRKEGTLLGTFTVFRQEVQPFSDKQIALLQNFAAQAVIAMENARLLGELRERTRDLEESLEYQTATSDVLKVISRSGAELAPMLDTLVETAARICRAESGFIFRLLGGLCHMVASFGIPEEYKDFQERNPIAPGRGTLAGRIALDRCPVHIEDAATDPEYTRVQAVHLGRQRTMLGVPLVREDALIGVLTLARSRVEPFAEKEIALVTTFADQAVIAIENARLFDELHGRTRDLEESLEYQTATSDVLQVMSRSTFELQPVLETLVETAARLCKADMAFIHRREGELYYPAVNWGFPPEFEAFVRARGKFRPHRGTLSGRAVLERRIVRIDDYDADPELIGREATALGKPRTGLGAPLLREGEPIGVIALTRQRGEPFTERQIELVRTFADQAVIAIENSRLITETREALERQQAIAEVLQVINSSPGNLSPVYEVILEKARNLCGVPIGNLALYDGQQFRAAALHGIPQEFLEEARRPFSPGPAHERLVRGEPLVHIPDFLAVASGSGSPASRALVALGVRTTLLVPLRRDTTLLGYIAANRLEVRPFSEKEIALLESFAAQAVIAMDNARLLDEIRQRQAELRVTFDNMGDGVAMFDANLQLAAWNLNFQQILDIPDAMLIARPSYVDYLRTLARRGEFGSVDIEAEVARRVAAIDQELHFEHTRPDGHIIEVRRNAVPGGGFVLIYGDVTERKRAEAEIRAARDAAERALGELRATQQQLVVQQKMAALGQLTAGIAHEIKNPLNFVNNFAGISIELLDELKADAEPALATLEATKRAEIAETVEMLTGNLEKIAEHGRRADGIVKSMLEHSRGSSADRRAVDLNGLVEEALNLAYHGGRAQDQSFNVTLERDYAAAVAPIELVPQDITRVCLNLIGNGFYAITKRQKEGEGDAEFKPTLKVSTRDLGSAVEIRIRDNGVGIAPEFRDRLFQPFFTTKPTGEGTGLGLSISYDIVTQEHGGTITVDSQVGEFTEFTIRLPRVYGAAVAEAAS